MNPVIGWTLAVLAIAAAYHSFGLKGVALGVTLVVFWLVLQLNRSIRAMKNASDQPIGHVGSAVMLNAKLKAGMTLLQVITLTRSLGKKAGESPERWSWTDESDSTVTVTLERGKVTAWNLERPLQPDEADALPPAP